MSNLANDHSKTLDLAGIQLTRLVGWFRKNDLGVPR